MTLCKYNMWVWTWWEWQLCDKWSFWCSCGWAQLNCVVYTGICHWSRQEIWGRRGLNEGENSWTISRENMRFYWLLFTLQKHENRTESIRIQLKRLATAQLPKQIGLSPRSEEDDTSRTLFWSTSKARTRNSSHHRGRKKDRGGNYRWLKDIIYTWGVGKKRRISRVAIVWKGRYPTSARYGPRGEGCDGDPRLRSTERRVWDTRRRRGLRGNPPSSTLSHTARSRVSNVNNRHARNAAVDAA